MKDTETYMSARSEHYSVLNGIDIYKVTITGNKLSVVITNIGCAIAAIYTPDNNGTWNNIVAGYENLLQYLHNKDYYGCVVGRYANRISNACFKLGDDTIQLSKNNGRNHLHGGFNGFGTQIWQIESLLNSDDEAGVVLSYLSRDGEEGYPGNLAVTVTYILTRDGSLRIRYRAVTDKKTPVSLTNHSYFNLTGFSNPSVLTHLLEVNAKFFLEKNDNNVPSGRLLRTMGTALDFNSPALLGNNITAFPSDRGYDHNFVLGSPEKGELVYAAGLSSSDSGRSLKVWTDQPGMQVYTANYWDGSETGAHGAPYLMHGAVALETQAFPDSPNHAHFPPTILAPGEEYLSTTVYEFKTDTNLTSIS